MADDFDVQASWATEPFFYRAPFYDNDAGFKPMPYQHAGVEYRIAREHAIIGDAPGLGKSCEGVLTSNAIGAEYTLVVCPASLRLNWEREIWLWSTIGGVTTYPVNKASDGVSLKHNYVIISYNLLNNPNIFAALMDERWDHLILDEAHALKDPKGNARTKAICGWYNHGTYVPGLVDVCDRLTLATGTLMPNQPIEAYNAIRLTDHEAINCCSLEEFRNYYYEEGSGMVRKPVEVVDDKTGQTYTVSKLVHSMKVRNVPRNLADLQWRLRKYCMVRRLKPDVLPQLPPKQWNPVPLATTPAMRKALKHPGWKQAETLYELDTHAFDTSVPIDGDIATARRELGEAKAPAVAAHIIDMLESGVQKIVVSAWHRNSPQGQEHSVLGILRAKLSKYGLVYMDGTTSTTNKQKAVDQFQTNDDIRIILGQMIPLGEGWTLTEAQDVVFAEPDWVPGKNDQLLDRVNRMGQKGAHTIGHIMVVPDSMDEKILGTAIEKDGNIYLAMDHRGDA